MRSFIQLKQKINALTKEESTVGYNNYELLANI